MPELIKLYIRSCIIGFGIAAIFVAGLLYLDVAHLRHLVFNSQGGALAIVVLWMLNGIVFAGVQFGIAIMQLADDTPKGGGLKDGLRRLMPVWRSSR